MNRFITLKNEQGCYDMINARHIITVENMYDGKLQIRMVNGMKYIVDEAEWNNISGHDSIVEIVPCMHVMTEPDVRMCRGALYESAFRVFDIPIYSYELYEDGAMMGTSENCVRIAKELGICQEEAAAGDIMTRGETVQLLYLLSTKEYQLSEPPIMSELNIQNPDGIDLNKFLLELEEIPQEIRDKYEASGWKYIIDCEAVSQYAKQLNVSCIGVCDYAKKSIYVSESSATIHEFGHFLHRVIGFPASFEAIYAKEADNARSLLREYSLTSSKEYFADCFRYWIWHQQNDTMLGRLQEVAPETYAFFFDLANNGWAI